MADEKPGIYSLSRSFCGFPEGWRKRINDQATATG